MEEEAHYNTLEQIKFASIKNLNLTFTHREFRTRRCFCKRRAIRVNSFYICPKNTQHRLLYLKCDMCGIIS